MSSKERREDLGLPTLEKIRIRGDVITIFKFLRGHEEVNTDQFFKIKRIYKPRNWAREVSERMCRHVSSTTKSFK